MGYIGCVVGLGVAEIADMKHDVESNIGRKIRIGFIPDYPENEHKYTLQDAHVGMGVKGAYIHFVLELEGDTKEFIIDGIKFFEYDVIEDIKRYGVSVSAELLAPIKEGQTEFSSLKCDQTYRFILFTE